MLRQFLLDADSVLGSFIPTCARGWCMLIGRTLLLRSASAFLPRLVFRVMSTVVPSSAAASVADGGVPALAASTAVAGEVCCSAGAGTAAVSPAAAAASDATTAFASPSSGSVFPADAANAAMARVVAAIKPGEKTITEASATVVFGSQNECFYNKVQVKCVNSSTLLMHRVVSGVGG